MVCQDGGGCRKASFAAHAEGPFGVQQGQTPGIDDLGESFDVRIAQKWHERGQSLGFVTGGGQLFGEPFRDGDQCRTGQVASGREDGHVTL